MPNITKTSTMNFIWAKLLKETIIILRQTKVKRKTVNQKLELQSSVAVGVFNFNLTIISILTNHPPTPGKKLFGLKLTNKFCSHECQILLQPKKVVLPSSGPACCTLLFDYNIDDECSINMQTNYGQYLNPLPLLASQKWPDWL